MEGHAAPRHRRLGARLLPQLPEPAPGLSRGLVERRRLGRGRRAVRARRDRSGRNPARGDAYIERCPHRSRFRFRVTMSRGHNALGVSGGTDRRRAHRAHRRGRSTCLRGALPAVSRSVLGLALRRFGDRGRAEDASQEAFVAIWRSAGTYDPEPGKARRGSTRSRAMRSPTACGGRPSLRRFARTVRAASPTRPRRPSAPGRPGASIARSSCFAERARGHRARLLARALPERDRRVLGIPLGTVKTRTRSALARVARGAGRGAGVTQHLPTSTTSSATRSRRERDRLRRVHDLLVAAGPPPDVSTQPRPRRPSSRCAHGAGGERCSARSRSRSRRLFTLGLVVAAGDDPSAERVDRDDGPPQGARARRSRSSRSTRPGTGRCSSRSTASRRRPTARSTSSAYEGRRRPWRSAAASWTDPEGVAGRPDERAVADRRLRRLGRRRGRLGRRRSSTT